MYTETPLIISGIRNWEFPKLMVTKCLQKLNMTRDKKEGISLNFVKKFSFKTYYLSHVIRAINNNG